jgi:tetratricopeptide (TPR) repeat protein
MTQIHPGALPTHLGPNPQLSFVGPKPLLTNPHPTTTPKPVATRAAAQRTLASPQSIAAANAASLSAAVAAGKDPATVALYLASQNNWGRGNWGWGWGGYAPFGFYGFSPFGFVPWGYGPGFGIGFAYHTGPFTFGLGYNFGYSPYMPYAPVYAEAPVVVGAAPPLLPQPDAVLPPPASDAKPAQNFAERGQDLFLQGKYDDAVKEFRHAVVDDPKNGPLLALTGEALWAAGSYNEAAGAIQQSLLATPEADWAAVAGRAARLTPTEAVTKVGAALNAKEQPDLRFLAAYQSFGAGKYGEAAAHLDVLLKNAPNDQVAKKLREQAAKLNEGK